MPTFDTLIVGSGINSLVCAALLTQRGQRVCVLERNDVLGGCIRTEELTRPGFRHDTLATLYPLFVTAPHFPALQAPLRARGAEFVNVENPTGVLMPDGRAAVFTRDRERNAEEFGRLAAQDRYAFLNAMQEIERHADLSFHLLCDEPWSCSTLRRMLHHGWRRGAESMGVYCGKALASCRSWLTSEFSSDVSRALIAPWVLHVGLGPTSGCSALMAKIVLFTLEAAGSPMVLGGGALLVEAFKTLIQDGGGECRVSAEVDRVLTSAGTACGVLLKAGEEIRARVAVVCNVTPGQLYGTLLREETRLDAYRLQASRYRFGRAEMQIHLALDGPPEWPEERLAGVAMLHLTPGMDAVTRAVDEADRGLLPAEATIVVAQPTAVDPTRAPPGKSILWIQLQELPSRIAGDAKAEIDVRSEGRWTAEIGERYADRIIDRLTHQIPNLARSIVGRHVISPADLERMNVNLVGGDPYSGDCSQDQFLLWRPFFAQKRHRTPIRGLYHIGAATHPGPGLGGISGYLVARQIASHKWTRRH
ncbi:MAG: phytoene desaturase family protein [Steroidobacteraceae bacterium]